MQTLQQQVDRQAMSVKHTFIETTCNLAKKKKESQQC